MNGISAKYGLLNYLHFGDCCALPKWVWCPIIKIFDFIFCV